MTTTALLAPYYISYDNRAEAMWDMFFASEANAQAFLDKFKRGEAKGQPVQHYYGWDLSKLRVASRNDQPLA